MVLEAVTLTVVQAAKAGDMTAAPIVLDRVYPARPDNPVRFELPAINTASDAAGAMGSLARLEAKPSPDFSSLSDQQLRDLIQSYFRLLLPEYGGDADFLLSDLLMTTHSHPIEYGD